MRTDTRVLLAKLIKAIKDIDLQPDAEESLPVQVGELIGFAAGIQFVLELEKEVNGS